MASVARVLSVQYTHVIPSGNGLINLGWDLQQLNLYKTTTKFCGLSRQVVFNDMENKHDFVKTVPGYLAHSLQNHVYPQVNDEKCFW